MCLTRPVIFWRSSSRFCRTRLADALLLMRLHMALAHVKQCLPQAHIPERD